MADPLIDVLLCLTFAHRETLWVVRAVVAVVELAEELALHEAVPPMIFGEGSLNKGHRHRLQSFQAEARAVLEVARAVQQQEWRQEQVEVAHESYRTGKDHSHHHQALVLERLREELEEALWAHLMTREPWRQQEVVLVQVGVEARTLEQCHAVGAAVTAMLGRLSRCCRQGWLL